jgi:hypothetical protein
MHLFDLNQVRSMKLHATATASIFLILELGQPFTGLMMISDQPLRDVLPVLKSWGKVAEAASIV